MLYQTKVPVECSFQERRPIVSVPLVWIHSPKLGNFGQPSDFFRIATYRGPHKRFLVFDLRQRGSLS